MDESTPPGPGWVQGPDGHWRPPSLFGPQRAPGAAPPPPYAPPPPPYGPPPGGSATRTALAVVGGIVTLGVALVVVSVVAVTFLGTTPDTPAGRAAGPTGDVPSTVGPGAIGEKGREPVLIDPEVLADRAASTVVRALNADRWAVDDRVSVGARGDHRLLCTTEDTGAGGVVALVFDHPEVPAGAPSALNVQIVSYESAEHAERARQRVATEEWRQCAKSESEAQLGGQGEVRFDLLPADPAAPGIAYTLTISVPGQTLSTPLIHISVGSLRAVVNGCGCRPGAEQVAARQVAAALAQIQGLPAPG